MLSLSSGTTERMNAGIEGLVLQSSTMEKTLRRLFTPTLSFTFRWRQGAHCADISSRSSAPVPSQTEEANTHVSGLQHEFCTQGFCTTGLNHPLPRRPPWKLVWRKSPSILARKTLKTQEQNQYYFKGFCVSSMLYKASTATDHLLPETIFRASAWRWKVVCKNEVTFHFKTRTAVSDSKTRPTALKTCWGLMLGPGLWPRPPQ